MPVIVPIFIMNRGCPHRCIFCNERLTAGNTESGITEKAFSETVRVYLSGAEKKRGPVQIAFYGGTFTGMNIEEQCRLLRMATPFLREGSVEGIRISTRPDSIDDANLDLLRSLGVTTVEVGAQSLDDGVLLQSRRGHSAADTVRALSALRAKGFETGIHLMAGLPGDNRERFTETIRRVIALSPDTVRIHPTIVLRDTHLASKFLEGRYQPLALMDAVELCKEALKNLIVAGIDVIRLGLQTTRELEDPGAVVAGPFHPAFRSLVESSIFLEMAAALLSRVRDRKNFPKSPLIFTVSPADLSNFNGMNKGNLKTLREQFPPLAFGVSTDPKLPRRTLILTALGDRLKTDCSGEIEQTRVS